MQKATATYKWCFLFNENFNQLINVFRNCGIEDSAKGNLRRILFSWNAEEEKDSYKKYRSFPMLYLHFSEKRFDINACPFFAVLGFNSVTRRQKRWSKNMNFLPHIREPLFHCVQGCRFICVRGSYDRRVTFPEDAIQDLIKRVRLSKFYPYM